MLTSIEDLPPSEQGGVISRKGFEFQDYVAACLCVDMLGDASVERIEIETQDDITRIFNDSSGEKRVEFIQVKNTVWDSGWTVANLCKSEKGKPGTSVLERSLARAQCSEPCCFRIVTSEKVDKDLDVLTYPHTAPGRTTAKLDKIKSKAQKKVGAFVSKNGMTHSDWVDKTCWEVQHSTENVKNVLYIKLSRYVTQQGIFLEPNQIEKLMDEIILRVQKAAVCEWEYDPNSKRIFKNDFSTWIVGKINEVNNQEVVTIGVKLKEKLELATLKEDTFITASEQRRKYRQESLNPKYLDLSKLSFIQSEVSAKLLLLRSRLDSGQLPDDGVIFHNICLEELDQLRRDLDSGNPVPQHFVYGYMYFLADRCQHRFRK